MLTPTTAELAADYMARIAAARANIAECDAAEAAWLHDAHTAEWTARPDDAAWARREAKAMRARSAAARRALYCAEDDLRRLRADA